MIHTRNAALLSLASGLVACAAAGPSPAGPAGPEPPREVRVLEGGVDARPFLTADADRAIAAGAGPLRMVGADVVAEGDRVGAFVEIPPDECLLALGRPSPTILDVDLFAYDDEGGAFATDESPEAQAAILACPPHPRRLYVMARVMAGSGILGVGVQSVPRAAADAVAKALGVRGRPGEDSGRLDAWPGLEGKIRAHRDSLGGRWEDVRRTALPVSPRAPSRVTLALEPDRCLDVLVTPSEEVASLEVVVEDATGRIIGRGRDLGHDRALVLCAAQAASVTLALRPRGSQGLAAVVVGRAPKGAEAEISGVARVVHLSETRDLDVARKALEAQLGPLGYSAPKVVASGAARVGTRTAIPVELPGGCARLDLVAGRPLVDVVASLWDDKGALLAEGRGGAGATLFSCGKPGKARLDLEAFESPGPFSLELRKDKGAPPGLTAHPVAAGRLLGRLAAGGVGEGASAAVGAVVVSLDPATRRTLPVPLAAGECVEVLAALDSGGSGLDLRLVDGAGESWLAKARSVTAERLCGTPDGKPGSVELRLSVGKADALVLVRPAKRP